MESCKESNVNSSATKTVETKVLLGNLQIAQHKTVSIFAGKQALKDLVISRSPQTSLLLKAMYWFRLILPYL